VLDLAGERQRGVEWSGGAWQRGVAAVVWIGGSGSRGVDRWSE